jgi:hypothetical protein
VTGAHLVAVAAFDDDLVAVGADRVHTAARAGALAERASERRGQAPRAAEQVARDERPLAAPHEREQADPAAGRELVELGGRAVRGAREDRVHGGRQRPEELSLGPYQEAKATSLARRGG